MASKERENLPLLNSEGRAPRYDGESTYPRGRQRDYDEYDHEERGTESERYSRGSHERRRSSSRDRTYGYSGKRRDRYDDYDYELEERGRSSSRSEEEDSKKGSDLNGEGNKEVPEIGKSMDLSTNDHQREIREGVRTIALFVVGLVAVGFLLVYLEFILIPLILSRFLVYVFQPFINIMIGKKKWPLCRCKTKLPRWLAVILVFLFLFALFALLGLIIYFSVKQVVDNSDLYLAELETWGERIDEWGQQLGFTKEQVDSWLPHIDWVDWFKQAVTILSNAIPQVFLVLIIVSYMLLAYDEKKDKSKLRRALDEKIRSYILAQSLIAIVSGVVHAVTLFVLGIDLAMFFGLMNFVLSWIPNVGAIIAVVLPVPVILLSPGTSLWVMALAIAIPIVYQVLSGQFVEPRILSKAVSLPELTVIISLMFWGTIWGIIGAMLSIPLTVAVKLYLEDMEDNPLAKFLSKLLANMSCT